MPDSPSGEGVDGLAAIPRLWGTTVDAQTDRPEALAIRQSFLADAMLVAIAAPPVTVTQGGSNGDSPHRFHLVLPDQGHGTYHWAHGTVTQRPEDIVLVDITEPSQLVSTVDSRLIRLSFPEEYIAPYLPSRYARAVLHLPAREGLMKVIAQHARALACEADRLDRVAQHALLAHLCGLLGLAIETETSSRPARQRHRSFQRQRVLTYIETHLRDPDCTAKRAAHDLGMSVRWLHALLEGMADGFADLVARRRLETSLALLEDTASDHLSIAEIAFLSGFNDLSTFYRRFGEHYGMTPGNARRRRTARGAPLEERNTARCWES